MSEDKSERLSAAARDVLLAEALGDIHRLQESINTIAVMVQKLKSHVDGQAQQEMVAVLDQKMNEFRHFQIPVVAASKLQAHAEIFLRGVMAEIQRLVTQEISAQAFRARGLVAAGALCVGFVVGFAVRSIF
jgi:3-phosphoglycerate kinase